jgi:putative transposase
MTKRKQHSIAEIEAKLAEANDLATQGIVQSEIASTLGVSVMTLHRWRKAWAKPAPADSIDETVYFEQELGRNQRIADLQLENSRLRRLVTDLLLEKMKLEEANQGAKLPLDGMRREAR